MEIKADLVSANLHKLLEERNMSQAALARKAKIGAPYLNKVINGSKPLGIQVATKLARALDCSIEEITEGRAPVNKPAPSIASLLTAMGELEKELTKLRSNPLVALAEKAGRSKSEKLAQFLESQNVLSEEEQAEHKNDNKGRRKT